MAANHKLTTLLKGRRIVSTANSRDILSIGFDDGSVMTVQTAGSTNAASTGSAIASVRQQDTTLHLDFEGGGTWAISTAEPTSSVLVRDKDHTLEYSD